MAQSQRISRPGNEQYLQITHDGDEYEAERLSYRKDVGGEVVDVEEYRLEEADEDVPDEVVAEVDRVNEELAPDVVDDVQEEA